jgi:hypothetical protein
VEKLTSLATIRGLVKTINLWETTSSAYVYRFSTKANTQHHTMAQSALRIVVAVDFGQSRCAMVLAYGLHDRRDYVFLYSFRAERPERREYGLYIRIMHDRKSDLNDPDETA